MDRTDEEWVFRYHKKKVWYLKASLEKLAGNIAQDNLVAAGVCFGKFTHSGKFRLGITCLDYIAQYAQVCACSVVRPTTHTTIAPTYHHTLTTHSTSSG